MDRSSHHLRRGRPRRQRDVFNLFYIISQGHININIENSPTSLDNVSIPDKEDIFETPRKAALKKRVRELTFKKKLLQKKNKVLVQQNKRLKKRVATVAVILRDLKTKDYISKEQFLQLNLKTEVLDLII